MEENNIVNQIPDDNEIPEVENSSSFNVITSRFSSALWYERIISKDVILAGLGGIGSYVGFLLSRLNINKLTLYDFDKVELGNLSGQFYSQRNIASFKADALADTMVNYSAFYHTFCVNDKFNEFSSGGPIMICGFDNMEARGIYFNAWLHNLDSYSTESKKKCLFIDGRLAAEEFQVLCIRGDDRISIDRYRKDFLFPDSEVEETVCSYKQTTFMANMIGSIIVNLFVNFVANECNPLIDRDLPFYTTYNAETMYLKTVS